MGRPKTIDQMKDALRSKLAIGESRHAAKNEARQELERQNGGKSVSAVLVRVDTIHSYNTYYTYLEHCTHFVEWCQNEKGKGKYVPLEKLEPLAKEYLKEREERGDLSLYTLKAEKAALGKLYGHEIDHKFKEARTIDKITRSRNETARERNFSESRNADLVNIAKGTGGRREDLGRLTGGDFFHDDKGNLWVRFEGSKGGRDRETPVLPKYQKEIEKFIEGKDPNKPLFERIHNAADIHAYRREYAKNLYNIVKDDKDKAKEYAERYPKYEHGKRDKYIAKGDKETRFTGLKDNIAIVSQALGHNRLDITVNHYLK